MVKLKASTYRRILKQAQRWGHAISTKTTLDWDKGECDICLRGTRAQLQGQESDKESSIVALDPGWLLCEEHARLLGLLW